jgi:hypothetical protein
LTDSAVDSLDKVDAGFNGLDVAKYLFIAEMILEFVSEPSGIATRIIAAVADENAGPGLCLAP